jgi:hypothetical protein
MRTQDEREGQGREGLRGSGNGGGSGREGRGRGLVCVVYSGDYPEVGKEEILGRVFVSPRDLGFSEGGWWVRG